MVAWAPIIAAAAPAVGQAIGGLLGGGDGPGLGEQNKTQLLWDKKRATELPSAVVAGAEKAGLHPLAALGMNMSGGVGASVGGGGPSPGQKAAALGEGISSAVSRYQSAEDQALARSYSKAQLQNLELQNSRLASEVRLMNQPSQPPALSRSIFDGQTGPFDHAMVQAELRGDPDFWFQGRRNWTQSMLNQMEADYLAVPQAYLGRAYRDFIETPGRKTGQWIRDLIDALRYGR